MAKAEQIHKIPLVIQCADKFAVRSYIEDCGYGKILNELYGAYDQPEDIPWDALPNQFVLKWNFGAGMNIICADKSKLDIPATMKQLRKWGKTKPWLPYAEMRYKYAPKKIICERFLKNEDEDVIPDYKVYCFNGKPLAVFVMHDRGKSIKSEFFDADWNLLENTNKYGNPTSVTARPACLEEMLECSKKLSEPFPFVRCDYYVVNGQLFFGEMTFTPAGGLFTSTTRVEGKEMTELLMIK